MKKLKIQYMSITKLLSKFLIKKRSFLHKCIVNIVKLDLIFCYRAWRHFKGQPVRGQRTWTNSLNSFKVNTVLRNLKLRIAKNVYGSFPNTTLLIASNAEQYNLLWFRQWRKEWDSNKARRLSFSKKSKNIAILDLNSTSRGKISGSNRAAKKGKKKRVYKKNTFTIGFSIGFTKWLIRESKLGFKNVPIRTPAGHRIQVIISTQTEKKKIQKKISSQKKKQDKLAKAKKKKTMVKQKGAELKRLKTQKLKNLAKSRKKK
jgi:hypothetical protein